MLTIGLIDNCAAHRSAIGILFRDYLPHINVVDANNHQESTDKVFSPDLFVIGVSYGKSQEGLRIVRQCKSSFGDVPLIVYEECCEREVAEAYLHCGAKGYILKQNILSDMIPCIRAVLRGRFYLCGIMRHIVPGFEESDQQRYSQPALSLWVPREDRV